MAKHRLPDHVHRVGCNVKGGTRWHFYAWRGGPRFWTGEEKYPTDPAFSLAYAAVAARPKPKPLMTPGLVDAFLYSPALPKGERTRADYRTWALRFAEAFKDDPPRLFEDPGSRGEVNEWRSAWAYSPRQYDYAGTIATLILNWAVDQGKIGRHHCGKLRKVYEVDRADIVWTWAHRKALDAKAPERVRRILSAACETGLRPDDLCGLTRAHIEVTVQGRGSGCARPSASAWPLSR